MAIDIGPAAHFKWSCCGDTAVMHRYKIQCPNCGEPGPVYVEGDARDAENNGQCLGCWQSSAGDSQGHGQVCEGNWTKNAFVTIKPIPAAR